MTQTAVATAPTIEPTGPTEQWAESETFRELVGMAERRVGHVPADVLARHIVAITPGGDWPVREAAAMALFRRWSFARRDELQVLARPPRGRVLGLHRTGQKRSQARPYATLVGRLDPIRASCDCTDFVHNSLGICKHVLVVLDSIFALPDWAARANEIDAAEGACAPRLTWDPVRPLTGRGDWLERVSLHCAKRSPGRPSKSEQRVRSWFVDGGAEPLALRPGAAQEARRAELVSDLFCFAKSGGPARQAAEPALLRLLADEHARLERVAASRVTKQEAQRHARSLSRKLYPYQMEGVRRFLDAGRLLLADDMGLGKTAQAIASCHILWSAQKVKRGLVIAPASLKAQWLREWRLFSDVPTEVVDGHPDDRAASYRRCGRGFLIANYEQVLRDLELIRRFAPDIVVLDEAQRIKNWATKTAAYVKAIDAPYRLVLTGTPMENRLDELSSILEWVDPSALEPSWRLGAWHTQRADGRNEVAGARNLDTLRSRLANSMVRRVRQEVLAQLPPRTDTRLAVEVTEAQRSAHAELDLPIARLVSIGKRRPLAQAEFLKLMQLLTTQRIICNGMALHGFAELWPQLAASTPSDAVLAGLATPKLAELRALLEAVVVEQRRKVVIFSQWRRMLQLAEWATRDLLARHGLRACFFTGLESQKRRTQNVVDFHDDPRACIFFATDAGGVGLNLQRAASCCVNLELPWNPAVLEQRIGRVYRLGQTEPVTIYNLVSEEGIESRILDLVGNKQALFKGLFDGDSDAVAFANAGTFLTRIEKVVEEAPVPTEVARDGDDAETAAEENVPDVSALDDESPATTVTTTATESPRAAASLMTGSDGAAIARREMSTDLHPESVARLLDSIEVSRASDGGLSIKAPPHAAATLSALFSSMARMLAPLASPAPSESAAQPAAPLQPVASASRDR